MHFNVWGNPEKIAESLIYKEGWLVIKDEQFVLALLKAGTCYTDKYLKANMRHGIYDLKFGSSPFVYCLTYGGDGEWWLFPPESPG